MEITPITALRFPAEVSAVNRAWAIGQLLDVTVIGASGRNSTALRVGDMTIESTTPVPFAPGTRLAARVVALQPTPVLEAHPADSARAETATAQSLRGLLPRKLDPGPAWQALSMDILELLQQKPDSVAPSLLRTAHSLVERVPDLRSLATPGTLQSSVALNGQALEATLALTAGANAPSPPMGDRKWQLLEVLAQWPTQTSLRASSVSTGPLPGIAASAPNAGDLVTANMHHGADGELAVSATQQEIKHKVEGLLAHVTTRQLQTAAAAEAGHMYGMFELPVKLDGETSCLQIEYGREHASSRPEEEASHVLLVVVPLPGATEIRVRLSAVGNRLSVVAWAPDSDLQERLMMARTQLVSRLTACGFETGDVVVAPLESPRDDAYLPRGLVDTRA